MARPIEARFRAKEDSEGSRIEIPMSARWFEIAMLLWPLLTGLWMAAIGLGGGGRVAAMVGLAIAGGTLYMVAWRSCGMEVVLVQGGRGRMVVRRELWGWAHLSREYDLAFVRRLRVSYGEGGRPMGIPMKYGPRRIAFDYGAATKRFGLGLDEWEAERVAEAVRERLGLEGE